MRFLFTILLLSAVVACGKGGSGGSGSANPEAQQCEINGEVVSCDSIYDGLGVDVLNAKIDVPATIDSSSITFSQARSVKSDGRRISCAVAVNAGDVYRYTISGDSLYLDTPAGNMTMKRVHGSGIMGMWRWTGYVDGATYQERLLTVSKNRIILQRNCER